MSCSDLHVSEFLKDQYPSEQLPPDLLDLFLQFSEDPTEIVEGVTNPALVHLLKAYEKYSEKKKQESMGKLPSSQ